jgi:hypothetical protein
MLPTSTENIHNKETPVKQATNQTLRIGPYVACQLGARNPNTEMPKIIIPYLLADHTGTGLP